MKKTNLTKKRLLSVLDIFKYYSDENHYISLDFVLSKLHERNIISSKFALYDDIKVLNESGYKIIFESNKGYFMVPLLEISEMKVIADGLNAANFLSKSKTSFIMHKICYFQSFYQQETLNASMLNNPLKQDNNHLLYHINTLLNAIHQNSSISFYYFDIDITLKKTYRKNKKRYHLLPYALLWHNQSYYCIGYDQKYQNLSHYRLDKMDHVALDEVQDKPYFDLSNYTSRFIDMYISEKTNVTLRCKRSLAPLILEKFKNDLLLLYVDDEIFEFNINIDPSITFITWLFTFKKEIEVLKPQSLINDIQDVINELQSLYFKD